MRNHNDIVIDNLLDKLSTSKVEDHNSVKFITGRNRKQELEAIVNQVANKVYNDLDFMERAEYAGLLEGNLHHGRQKLAEIVKNDFISRLKKEDKDLLNE